MSPRTTDLAILGAGPIGLDAALAAAERDLDFRLFEAGPAVADAVRRWGHVELFTPWSMNLSRRMRRALGNGDPFDDAVCPTGTALVEEALEPLAESRALRDRIATSTRVLGVGREGLLKHEAIGAPERAERPFRLLLETPGGREIAGARRVLDCTGASVPNALGDGGIPAPGEAECAEGITHDLPDPLGEAGRWAGRRTLLVGAGHSAQTAALAFAELVAGHPGTEVAWAMRRPRPSGSWGSPEGDPLGARRALAERAGRLVAAPPEGFTVEPDAVVEALASEGGRIAVLLRDLGSDETRRLLVDRIVALTGRVGDDRLYRQLQVHECYATSGPMKLSAALLGADGAAGGDCLAQSSPGADVLRNPEPDFFLLGSKSYGRRNDFLLRVGYEQVDQIFELLAPQRASA